MAPKVVKPLSDAIMYKRLIRMHLPDDTRLNPRSTRASRPIDVDLAVVTADNEKFLCEVGRTGCKINVSMLTTCLHEHFHNRCGHSFAGRLADALAFCRAEGKPCIRLRSKRILNGTITPQTVSAVNAVISAINESIMASSAEGEAVKLYQDNPGGMVGGAAAALQRLQEAFAGESQGSATACSSTSPHA
jgi:hypothetical protein